MICAASLSAHLFFIFYGSMGYFSVLGPIFWRVLLPNSNQWFQTLPRCLYSLVIHHRYVNSELQMIAEKFKVGCQKKETLSKGASPLPFSGLLKVHGGRGKRGRRKVLSSLSLLMGGEQRIHVFLVVSTCHTVAGTFP